MTIHVDDAVFPSFTANGGKDVFDNDNDSTTNGSSLLSQLEQDKNVDKLLSQLGGEPLHETIEYGLRFAGVARLYAKQLEVATAAAAKGNTNNAATLPSADSTLNNADANDESCPIMESDAAQTVLERLSQATVIIVGLGGVGSWAAEALCRSGVGHLVLIDLDDICISNTNRQVHTLSTTVGHMKIDEMKRRLQDIHPYCRLTLIHDFVSSDNVRDILTSVQQQQLLLQQQAAPTSSSNSLVCLDAMDAVPDKVALIAACADLKIPIVTCGGAAEIMDPTRIQSADLSKVTEDFLLRACRKMLRQEHGFQRGLPFHLRKRHERSQPKEQQQQEHEDEGSEVMQPIEEQAPVNGNVVEAVTNGYENIDPESLKFRRWNIEAIYSTELPLLSSSDTTNGGKNDESAFRRCDCAAGTACFVTGTFGFVAAGRILDMIAHRRFPVPRRR